MIRNELTQPVEQEQDDAYRSRLWQRRGELKAVEDSAKEERRLIDTEILEMVRNGERVGIPGASWARLRDKTTQTFDWKSAVKDGVLTEEHLRSYLKTTVSEFLGYEMDKPRDGS